MENHMTISELIQEAYRLASIRDNARMLSEMRLRLIFAGMKDREDMARIRYPQPEVCIW